MAPAQIVDGEANPCQIRREHGLERFPQPAEVQIDAAALGVDEKALILFRHAKGAALPPAAVDLVRAHGWSIVSHRHFTPERIRRFVRERLLELASGSPSGEEQGAAVAAEIREPTEAIQPWSIRRSPADGPHRHER